MDTAPSRRIKKGTVRMRVKEILEDSVMNLQSISIELLFYLITFYTVMLLYLIFLIKDS